MKLKLTTFLTIGFLSLSSSVINGSNSEKNIQSTIIPGADQLEMYLPLIKGKKVGIMGNQTSVIGKEHLVDVLFQKGVDIKFAFAPEHGFRGNIERGEKVSNDRDTNTG